MHLPMVNFTFLISTILQKLKLLFFLYKRLQVPSVFVRFLKFKKFFMLGKGYF
jgi:hypothetical protein